MSEGEKGFNRAESDPKKIRRMVGNPKDIGAGKNARTGKTSMNLPQNFEEAARSEAAK